jgi:hypothetical protein
MNCRDDEQQHRRRNWVKASLRPPLAAPLYGHIISHIRRKLTCLMCLYSASIALNCFHGFWKESYKHLSVHYTHHDCRSVQTNPITSKRVSIIFDFGMFYWNLSANFQHQLNKNRKNTHHLKHCACLFFRVSRKSCKYFSKWKSIKTKTVKRDSTKTQIYSVQRYFPLVFPFWT